MELLNSFLDQAFIVILLGSGIPLVITAVVGLLVAILQTAMQVQEQSAAFLVKLLAFCTAAYFGGEYFFSLLTTYLSDSLVSIASLGAVL